MNEDPGSGRTPEGWDERAFITRFEAAGIDELARILSRPTRREEEALVTYLGEDRYQRMHVRALRRNLRRATDEPKGNVVVLHGIMGAELTATDRSGAGTAIWVRPLRLLAGAIRRLQLGPGGLKEQDANWTVEASAILTKHYGELLLALSENWRVVPFFYDWRKDLRRAADALNTAIARHFPSGETVHIVAHSMGGLVARTFIADYPERWQAIGGRLVMLGTPNHGSYDIVRALAGRERLIRLLALADFRMSLQELLGILNSFPGTYQLLPSPDADPAAAPLYEKATYDPVFVSDDHLRNAREHHARLTRAVDPERMVYVAGARQATFVGVDVARVRDDRGYRVSQDGDGRVGHALGILKGVTTYYAEASHGGLTREPTVLQAVHELLRDGTTSVLGTDPPAARGVQDEDALRKELQQRDSRDEEALRGLLRQLRVREASQRGAWTTRAPGGTEIVVTRDRVTEQERRLDDLIVRGWLADAERPAAAPAATRPSPPTIQIAVLHGDIVEGHRAAGNPLVDALAVGHYIGVKPQYAEAALDQAISSHLPQETESPPGERGVLTQLTLRGTITGELGQPFLMPDPRPRANRLVALAGLGYPGRLGVGELTVAVRELCWAIGRLGCRHLATVLIGSGADNLTPEEAVEGWANGVAQALAGQHAGATRLERITVVERDASRLERLDAALAGTADAMRRDSALEIKYEPASARVRSRWRAASQKVAEPDPEDDARGREPEPVPTRITASREPGGYRFGAITQTASVPERVIPLDASLVAEANDVLAAEADDYRRHDRGRFLGRLLLPAELRAGLGGGAPVVMVLDATTARIHWELVTRPGAEPATKQGSPPGQLTDFLGVGAGFTRQLRTTFAPPPEPPPPSDRRLRVLVVADPAEDAHLPGAEEEGSEVADLFDRLNSPHHPASVEVVRLFGPRQASRAEVLQRLMLERFHVLHFAGHCFYNPEHPSASGWIFSDGATISANELRRIDRVPEFVFSNACESGITPDRSGERSAELAPSFAESFFARGVGNFVCTAWPVDDSAARIFATMLYGGLLGLPGTPGDQGPLPMYRALREARGAVARTTAGGARSWGAYQHYGDPLYRLVSPSTVANDEDDAGNEG
jgi:pimeloyl-ACP methyl ester carboxylesterase